MCRVSLLVLVMFAMITRIANDVGAEVYAPAPQESYVQKFPLYKTDEEYIRHIHSMINAYRRDIMGGRLIVETNALIDTKYKTWKRSADIINSLLSLPKGLDEAGR